MILTGAPAFVGAPVLVAVPVMQPLSRSAPAMAAIDMRGVIVGRSQSAAR